MLATTTQPTVSTDVKSLFIIYDDIIYYRGTAGGLYRAPLSDTRQIEELCDKTPLAIAVCDGYVYFASEEDYNALYRVPIEGGECEMLLDRYITAINVIDDVIYVSENAVQYVVLPIAHIPALLANNADNS